MSGEDQIIVLLESLISEMRIGAERTHEKIDRLERAVAALAGDFRIHRDHTLAQVDRLGDRIRVVENYQASDTDPAPAAASSAQ